MRSHILLSNLLTDFVDNFVRELLFTYFRWL
jgi:hypothetical protein